MSSSDPAASGNEEPDLHVEGVVQAPVEDVWSALFDPDAMARWVRPRPSAHPFPFRPPEAGSVQVLQPRRHLRLSWRPEGWSASTILYVRAHEPGSGATRVSFHQAGLPGETERDERRAVMEEALDDLRRSLERT